MDLYSEPASHQTEATGHDRRGGIPDAHRGIAGWLRGPGWIALLFFVLTLFLTTRNNDYPYYYEKDAHSKVAQVLSGERNFYHPLLMLNGADAILRVCNLERTEHNAVVAGRWVMALCTAVAVAAFSLLGYRLRGPLTAISVGVLVMTDNLVFELAHFFKEDPALLMGLALSFLAMQHFWERPTRGSAAWLGAACALAVSGKYVGIAAFVLALALLWMARKGADGQRRAIPWGIFLLSFAGLAALINYQIILRIPEFIGGFAIEMNDVTRPSKRKDIPHIGQAIDVFDKLVHPWIFLLAAFQIGLTIVRRSRRPVEWMLFLYPAIFLLVLLFSPRLFTRHFLPVIAFLSVLAGFGLPALVEWGWPRLKRRYDWARRSPAWMPTVITLVLIALAFRQAQRPMFWKRYKAFRDPTREALIHYINTHLPPDAVIAADKKAFLVDPDGNVRKDHPIHCKVLMKGRLAYFGSVDELYEQGVTHLAVHGRSSPGLFSKTRIAIARAAKKDADEDDPAEDVEADHDEEEKAQALAKLEALRKMRNFVEGKEFYEELVDLTEEVVAIPSGRTAYIAPALKLYRLKPRPAAEPESAVPAASAEPPASVQ